MKRILLSSLLLSVIVILTWQFKGELNKAWSNWSDYTNTNIIVTQTIPRCINKNRGITVIGSSFYKTYRATDWVLRLNIVVRIDGTDEAFQLVNEDMFKCINKYRWDALSLMYSKIKTIPTIDDHKIHFYVIPTLFLYMDGIYLTGLEKSPDIVEDITDHILAGDIAMIGDTEEILSLPIQIDVNSQFGIDLVIKRYKDDLARLESASK